ncbi:MAG TPA: recombinase RecF [Bacteroidales bacterium]|nr:recombinase RecF [Bacteroidales bacterium]
MINTLKISNFKSIANETIDLSNVNVFIGENGSGKTNILEAIATLSAAKDHNLNINGLSSKGVRVTKPLLTMSSFIGQRQKNEIEISAEIAETNQIIDAVIYPIDKDDIYSAWNDKSVERIEKQILKRVESNEIKKIIEIEVKNIHNDNTKNAELFESDLKNAIAERLKSLAGFNIKIEFLTRFLIYNINTQSLRGIINNSKEIPLGINGEGLDILLHDFSKKEWEELKQYNHLISWLDEILIDETDSLKFKGHKLGRSSSFLYFKDKYMRKNNNIFAAENSNEGVLNILFYLALLISRKTPKFFAIDNIESSLNPKLCRTLMKIIANLAIEHNKQVLITTHNPAILDGINLFDDRQRLFIVKREDEGNTKVERLKLKPEAKEKDLKLSEMWMRGYLGGLPNNF